MALFPRSFPAVSTVISSFVNLLLSVVIVIHLLRVPLLSCMILPSSFLMKHWPIVSAVMDLPSVSADVIYRTMRASIMEHGVVRMALSESIPSFLRFGRKLLRGKHERQVPTCRKYHLFDLVCPNVVCFNCDQLGHAFSDCKEDKKSKCSVCKEDGHYAIDCKSSWWRRPEKVDTGDNDAAPAPLPEFRPSLSLPQPPSDESSSDGPPPSISLLQFLPDVPPSQPPSQSSPDVPPTRAPSCVFLSSQTSPSPSSGQPSSLSQNTPKQPSTQPSQSSQSTQFSQSSQTTQSSQSLFSPVESPSQSIPLSQEPSVPSSINFGSPTLSDLQLVAAADSQRSTASDQAIAAMEIPEDPGPTSPLRPSQISIRPPPPRVAPKLKPAILDFTDGPLRVNQLRLCRSVLVKRLNPHLSWVPKFFPF